MARIAALYLLPTAPKESEARGAGALYTRYPEPPARRSVEEAERTRKELEAALVAVAELALGFGPTVAFDVDGRLVWVDVTGCGHLHAHGTDPTGERTLLRRLSQKVHALGITARLAVAEGPRIAAAIARFAPPPKRKGAKLDLFVVPEERTKEALARLPLEALPVDEDTYRFLFHLGLRTVAEVQRMPRASLGTRLGAQVARVLSFLDGDDRTPLSPYEPPACPEERVELEYGVWAQEALLFVAKGLCDRLGARLEGRAMGAGRLEVVFHLDRALVPPGESVTPTFALTLPSPLAKSTDLFAVLRARLETVRLAAPALAVTVRASGLVATPGKALHLFEPEAKAERALPRLVAELAADLGDGCVGLLSLADTWELRERSVLVPLGAPVTAPSPRVLSGAPEPTRLLPEPVAMPEREVNDAHLVLRVEGSAWWKKGFSRSDYYVGWVPEEGAVAFLRKGEGSEGTAPGSFALEGWLD